MVKFTEVVPNVWMTLLEESTTSNTSSASSTLSSRIVIAAQRGELPIVSPGENVSDVLRDKKSLSAGIL